MKSLIPVFIRHFAGAVAGLGLGAAAVLAVAQEPPKTFILHDAPKPIAKIEFQDSDGKARSLADFRDKVVLLNVWATWCRPCRAEMPTLDRLQSELGGPGFEVLALSIDRAGIDVVTRFYFEVGVAHLTRYVDSSGRAAWQLSTVGLPTTLLIDREGREIGRLVGPAEWDAPNMVAFLRRHLSLKSSALWPAAANGQGSLGANQRASAIEPAEILRPEGLDLPGAGNTASSATSEGKLS